MKAALDGTPHDLHGAQVGVATVHCLDLWQRIVDSDPADFDTDILVARQPDPDALRGDILADWGEVADEVWNQWQAKALDPTGLHAEIDRIRAEFHALRAEVEGELLPPGVVADAIRAAGGPVDAAGLEVEPAVYERALRHARYLRDRFTVLDLAAELGLEG
jgi:glycerol-1-phosphate dehydrogenase [NAD(P)+]